MQSQRGVSAVVLLIVLIVLLVAAGAGFFVLKSRQTRDLPPQVAFTHINLNEQVVTFVFDKIPALYPRLLRLNREMTLVKGELERIAALENDFPDQKRFIRPEQVLWTSIEKRLAQAAATAEKRVEAFFVAYALNAEKGHALIQEEMESLAAALDEAIEISRAETSRIRVSTPKTPVDRLKDLLK